MGQPAIVLSRPGGCDSSAGGWQLSLGLPPPPSLLLPALLLGGGSRRPVPHVWRQLALVSLQAPHRARRLPPGVRVRRVALRLRCQHSPGHCSIGPPLPAPLGSPNSYNIHMVDSILKNIQKNVRISNTPLLETEQGGVSIPGRLFVLYEDEDDARAGVPQTGDR